MKNKTIKKVAIYPAIGIARVGNSPEYFLASDVPGVAPEPEGGYKDGNNLFKKQVPLFRVYALDENDKPLYEVTADEADIEWRVHVANRKAGWYQFNNALDLGDKSIPSTKRNGGLMGAERDKLIIDPGSRSISGKNKSGAKYKFDGGKFYDKEVPLGEIRTDKKGRLMVFGGEGASASRTGIQAVTFANNDGWHDDVSDGTVRATVTINGKKIEAKPAAVVCTPPNFGPGLFAVVTMYDVVYDLYVKNGWEKRKEVISFYEDIYPILYRMSTTQWVNEGFFILFGVNSPSDFTNPELIKTLSDPSAGAKKERMRIFEWFRFTNSPAYEPAKIPPHYGDLFGDYSDLPHVDLSVTDTQYEWLQRWAEGDFVTGEMPATIPFDKMDAVQQTDALLKVSLTECLGGPFHPGIEITWPFRHMMMWEEPYRLKLLPEGVPATDNYGPMLVPENALAPGGPLDGSGPGSLTRWLGVPWQTDEASCLSGYDPTLYLPLPSFWAARVPNTVLSNDSFERATKNGLNDGQKLKHFSYRVDWLRDFTPNYVPRINNMIAKWHELGVIARHTADASSPFLPEEWWVETHRKGPGGEDPTLKQVKMAERDAIIVKQKVGKRTVGLLSANVPDEGEPRNSRPLQRHEL